MIRGFKELLKANNIYFTIPLKELKNKSIGIDGDYFIRKYVDTSYKFTFDTIKIHQENIKKLFLYFEEHNINILWVWSNTNSRCYKCTVPISEDISETINEITKTNMLEKEYRVRKRNFIDKILLKYDINVIKAPGMACAQLVDASKRNIINYIFSDEEALLLDRCGYLITHLDPIFSNKTSVPVLIKSKILSKLGIGGKIFSYLCMSLGNLYCPTHPFFKYIFDPFKVYNFVVEHMNTFSKLKAFIASYTPVSFNYKEIVDSYNLCNCEYHIWFMKFLYAENRFYKVLIFHEDSIGCLNDVNDFIYPFFSSKDVLTLIDSNPFYDEVLYKNIECIICRKELNTDLLKGIDLLINKLSDFIPEKYLLTDIKALFNKDKDKTEYLLYLIKIIICTKTDKLRLSPPYKLIVALIYTEDINTEDILFIKRHSIKYNSNINFRGKYLNYKKKYSKFLELVKYLKMFLDNKYFNRNCTEENCPSVFYYMPQSYNYTCSSLDTKENINTNDNYKGVLDEMEVTEHTKVLENYYLCIPCLAHDIHSYNMSIDYLIEYIQEGIMNKKHQIFYKEVCEYLEGFLY